MTYVAPTNEQIEQLVAARKAFFTKNQSEAVKTFQVGNQYFPTHSSFSPCQAGGVWTLRKIGRAIAHFTNERNQKFHVRLDGTGLWNVITIEVYNSVEITKL